MIPYWLFWTLMTIAVITPLVLLIAELHGIREALERKLNE